MAGQTEDSQEDRTEAATTFRREEFRKQGVVAQSREVLSVVLFFVVGSALSFLGPHMLAEFNSVSQKFFTFNTIEALDPKRVQELLVVGVTSWGWIVAPLFGAVVIAGVVGGLGGADIAAQAALDRAVTLDVRVQHAGADAQVGHRV
ncbi:EscU/YscU/HrcU family type III secretion system export apparatus switch protein, partial [bacterium]|nr:EscU/YscU/HrcU family type III secretion system export apparatus switch protein [bacterium]